jgi:hypothetical protein
MFRLLAHLPSLSRQQVVSLSQSSCMALVELKLTGEGRKGGGGWSGAKSYDREKAWPSIKHSILSEEYFRLAAALDYFRPMFS